MNLNLYPYASYALYDKAKSWAFWIVLFIIVLLMTLHAGDLLVAQSPGKGKVFMYRVADGTIHWIGAHRHRDYVLETTLESKEHLLTRATVMGNPNRERFPNDDAHHCYARSVWDLHYHQGRIYIGCGDWRDNQGPIDIWSFGSSDTIDGRVTFMKEFTVDDESVDRFRSCGDRLLVPGIDPKESWELGNLYIKEDDQWRKMRTIPNGIHTFDVACFAGKLYVMAKTEQGGVLYESSDWGETWTGYTHVATSGEMAVLGDVLLWTADSRYLYQFKTGKPEWTIIPICPGMTMTGRVFRLTSFAGGVVYTLQHYFTQPWPEDTPRPLFFLNDFERGAVLVQQFQQKYVQDILVRDDICYVLTSHASDDGYVNAVYESKNLKQWTLIAKFLTNAWAHSLEEMDGIFYVGLASFFGELHPESGSICRLEP